MFIRDGQKWNRFVIRVDRDLKIKDLLIDELNFSVRSISKMKRDKNIYKNGQPAKPTSMAKPGDIIEIEINEEKAGFEGQDLGIAIVYEDQDLIVADKPPFMVVHPTKSHFDGTLANAITYHIGRIGEDCRIRFVNRLDMNTSGLVVIAKNSYAHHKLSLDMGQDRVHKEYLAIVEGIISQDSGTLDFPIYRETEDSISRVVDPRGQRSITHYRVLQRLDGASLVNLRLETGRTHQIRVHLSHIGHPIMGDDLYGRPDSSLIDRQALHAYKLIFDQPRLGDRIELKSSLPKDMVGLLEKLGGIIDDYK
ncbi:RluA family pseudouridine synthase [Peptostreptococcus stomatis]|uniref:RluA family pseudouridine synthase n=2 Tax=Peptostreptococcus stomatis TaxID=341694 RepID=UPI0024A87580|nr:RluA family pseudouridine synthase [Peptostreptococcus stomatis]